MDGSMRRFDPEKRVAHASSRSGSFSLALMDDSRKVCIVREDKADAVASSSSG